MTRPAPIGAEPNAVHRVPRLSLGPEFATVSCMSPARLPPVEPALSPLRPVRIGQAARLALSGGSLHTRPELAVPATAEAIRQAAPDAAPDPYRPGSLVLGPWRIWPTPEGVEPHLRARLIPIDAIGLDPDDRVIDPLGGRADLDAGRIRVPDAAWSDDPGVVLRAAALGSERAVRLPPSALEAMTEHAGQVLRAERETTRATLTHLLVGRRPAGALQVLARTGILPLMLPEAAGLIDFHKSSRHHHKDVWNHTRQVVRQAVPEPIIRWAALMHDIGKTHTRSYAPGGKVHFFRHDELGALMFEGIAHRLRFPPAMGERIRLLVLHHLRAGLYTPEWSDAAVRRFTQEMGPLLDDLFKLSRADVTSKRPGRRRRVMFALRGFRDRIERIRRADEAARPRVPKGLGHLIIRDLGVAPGPRVGELRQLCEVAVRDGRLSPEPDLAECLRFLRAEVDRDAA